MAMLWWHVDTNFEVQVIWGVECIMSFGFSAFPGSLISSEYDAAVHANRLEDRSAPGDFGVVHSLKHPREKNTGHTAKLTHWSIHQHIPLEPTLSSPRLSSLAVLFNLMLCTNVACFQGIKKIV